MPNDYSDISERKQPDLATIATAPVPGGTVGVFTFSRDQKRVIVTNSTTVSLHVTINSTSTPPSGTVQQVLIPNGVQAELCGVFGVSINEVKVFIEALGSTNMQVWGVPFI